MRVNHLWKNLPDNKTAPDLTVYCFSHNFFINYKSACMYWTRTKHSSEAFKSIQNTSQKECGHQ